MDRSTFSLLFLVILLNSGLAQTMNTQIYSKSLRILEIGFANDDNITLKAFNTYEIGNTDTLVYSTISIRNVSVYSEVVGYDNETEQIIFNQRYETSSANTKLFKQDINKLLVCLNEIVPKAFKENSSLQNVSCTMENLTIGFTNRLGNFSLSINGETIYVPRKKMNDFVQEVKNLSKMVSPDPSRI